MTSLKTVLSRFPHCQSAQTFYRLRFGALLLLTLILTRATKQEDEPSQQLRLAIVIFRHGDRTPLTSYPTDPMKEADWPNGFGQLTVKGQSQLFQLGKRLRLRYFDDFDLTKFVAKQIYVRSTDYDRTLMSAAALLQGLFMNKSILVPIHTVEHNRDCMLSNAAFCPRYKKLIDDAFHSETARDLEDYLRDMFSILSNYTGITNGMNLLTAERIMDTLFIEHLYNRLPQWASQYWDTLVSFMPKIRRYFFKLQLLTDEMVTLRISQWLFELLALMDKSVQNGPMLALYSAHDTTLSTLLSVLGELDKQKVPDYGALIILELHQAHDGIVLLSAHYASDSSATDLIPMQIPCVPCTSQREHRQRLQQRQQNEYIDDTRQSGENVFKGSDTPVFAERQCPLDCFRKNIQRFMLSEDELHRKCAVHKCLKCDILFSYALMFAAFTVSVAFLVIAAKLCISLKQRTAVMKKQ